MFWRTKIQMFKKLKIRKISWKLTFIYALIFSIVLVALNAGILFAVRYYLIKQAEVQVENSNRVTMNSLSSSDEHFDLTDPELLRQANTVAEINIRITDISGKSLQSSDKSGFDNISATHKIGSINIIEKKDKHFIFKNAYIIRLGTRAGILQVVYNMRKEYQFIRLLFILMAIADSIGMIMSILAGLLLSKQILKPIDKMTKAAMKISISDLNSRIDVGPSDDELSRLAKTFNEMIGRLQESFERQNRFVSDASHELRTPITIIKGYADIIDEWAKDDPQILTESVDAIRKESKGMTSLIEELLLLARGDSGNFKLKKENIDLQALIEEIVLESRLIAPDHIINSSVNSKIELNADKRLIKQMIRALVDNSIKYTIDGGSIEISAVALPEMITISVKDTGIGISKDDIPKLFDRFYRVDKARTKEMGGSGLGLSIVKWIVDVHQGKISVKSELDSGTTITASLPKKLSS